MRRMAMEEAIMELNYLKPEDMTDEQRDEYAAICDSRSRAEFRMMRESCGIEIAELAETLGVRLDTAKRWEHPTKGMPPSLRAWAYMDACYSRLLDAVETAVGQVEELEDELGHKPNVNVSYRRKGMPTRDGETVGEANAASRATIVALAVLGYGVNVEWADEGLAGLAAELTRP